MTKHKITAMAVAAFTIATLSIGASAASKGAVILDNDYDFSFSGYGGTAFSSPATKTNSKTYAEYVASRGYVGEDCYITLVVTSARNVSSTISESKKVTVLNGTASSSLDYDDPAPGYNSTNYLCALGSYYSASVGGTWNP